MLIEHFSSLIRGDWAKELPENERVATAKGAFAALLKVSADGRADTAESSFGESFPVADKEAEGPGEQIEGHNDLGGSNGDSSPEKATPEASVAAPKNPDVVPAGQMSLTDRPVSHPDVLTGRSETDTALSGTGRSVNEPVADHGRQNRDAEAEFSSPVNVADLSGPDISSQPRDTAGMAAKQRPGAGSVRFAHGSDKEEVPPPTGTPTDSAEAGAAWPPDASLGAFSQRQQSPASPVAATDRPRVTGQDQGLKNEPARQNTFTWPVLHTRQAQEVRESPIQSARPVSPFLTPAGFGASTPAAQRSDIAADGEDWPVTESPSEAGLVPQKSRLPPGGPFPGPQAAAASGGKEMAHPPLAVAAYAPGSERPQPQPVGAVLPDANASSRGEPYPSEPARWAPPLPGGPFPGPQAAAASGGKEMAHPPLAVAAHPSGSERPQPQPVGAVLPDANASSRGEPYPSEPARWVPPLLGGPFPGPQAAAASGGKEMAHPPLAVGAHAPGSERPQPQPVGAVLPDANASSRGEPYPTEPARWAPPLLGGPFPGPQAAAASGGKEMAHPPPAVVAHPSGSERPQPQPVGAVLSDANAPTRGEAQLTGPYRWAPSPPVSAPKAPKLTVAPFGGADADGSHFERVKKETRGTNIQNAEGSLTTVAATSSFATQSERRFAGARAMTEVARNTVQQIAAKVLDLGRGRFELSLSPSELGKVDMWLQDSENRLTLTVNAERPETMELIRRHIFLLEQELRQMGLGNLSLQLGTGGAPWSQDGQSRERLTEAEGIAAPSEPALPLAGKPVARDHLDLRL